MVSVNHERDTTMHTLLSAHINYETAIQRRNTLVAHAEHSRLARRARMARHDIDVGSVLPFRTVTTATAVTSTHEHASARVA